MTKEINWNPERPPSDLPDSNFAREFILRTMNIEDLPAKEEEVYQEALFGPRGYATKLFERFEDLAQPFKHPVTGDESLPHQVIGLRVYPEVKTVFDKAFLKYSEGQEVPLIFNDQFAGLTVHIMAELQDDDDENSREGVMFWITDENEAQIGLFLRGTEVWAMVKEGDKDFAFRPSSSSRKYISEIAEQLYDSDGSDD